VYGQNLDEWSFDVFSVNEASTDGHMLKYLGYEIIQKYNLINKFRVRPFDPYVRQLAICRPSGCTVASGVVVVGVCNRSQMRTGKCTCLIFGVSVGLDHGWKCTEGIFDRSKFKVTRDMSPTISGWLLVV